MARNIKEHQNCMQRGKIAQSQSQHHQGPLLDPAPLPLIGWHRLGSACSLRATVYVLSRHHATAQCSWRLAFNDKLKLRTSPLFLPRSYQMQPAEAITVDMDSKVLSLEESSTGKSQARKSCNVYLRQLSIIGSVPRRWLGPISGLSLGHQKIVRTRP